MVQVFFSGVNNSPKKGLKTIVTAGLVAGVLDGAAASLQFYLSTGRNPTRVFQYIASAVFGTSAFQGGMGMAALGLIFHLFIAIGFAALFYFLFPVLIRVSKNRIVLGILYGLFIWMIMNLIVVPLTRAPRIPFQIKGVLIGVSILILAVGIPISLLIFRDRLPNRKNSKNFLVDHTK